MPVAKQVADFLTFTRLLIGVGLAFLGWTQGDRGIASAALMMIGSWTTDLLDGALARRSRRKYRTWVGDHDLEADMVVSVGLLFYLVEAGFLSLMAAAAYLVMGLLVYWRWQEIRHSTGMLFQAPTYGYFIWVVVQKTPGYGWTMVVWIAILVIGTWPRFPREVIPGFLAGLRSGDDVHQTKR